MDKKQQIGHSVFAVLFVLSILCYSILNALFAQDAVTKAISEFDPADPAAGVSHLNTAVTENILWRHTFLEAYGGIQILQGKQEQNAFELVRDRAGYLHSGNFWNGFHDDTKELAIRVRRLKDALNEAGTQVGFILSPMKIAQEDMQYTGVPYNDFTQQADTMLRWLRYYGIPCLDMREVLSEGDLSYDEIYFKTDHHWSPRAAFCGFSAMVDWMNDLWDTNLDPDGYFRNLNHYETLLYENYMLGSQGRKAGILYSGGTEDYEVLFPTEGGSFLRVCGSLESSYSRTGTFSDAFIDFEINPDPYSGRADIMYLGGVYRYEHIENQTAPNDIKILLLRDSQASIPGAFLSQTCSQVDMLWSLAYESGEIEAFLAEHHYDYVLIMLYPENLAYHSFPFYESTEAE